MATELSGRITTLPKQKIQNNHDLLLSNVWLHNPSAYKPQLWNVRNSPNVDAYEFLFVALSKSSPDFLTNILKKHKEKRIYLLLPNDFEGALPDHKQLLYRRVSGQFLDVCVGGKGDVAYLCLSKDGAYRLDKQQSKDIFGYLLYRFWHESDAEKTWTNKETTSILSRPADIDRPIGTVQYISLSGSTTPKSPCYSGYIGYRSSEFFTHRMLPPTHPNLPKKKEHDFVWTDMGDFTIKVKDEETWVEYELDFEHRFVLRLGPKNAAHVAAELGNAINNPNWRFHQKLQQGKIQHPIWVMGEASSRKIEEEQIFQEKDIEATSLHLMASLEPQVFQEGSDYFRQITWKWNVIPPYKHQKSKIHLLHETWDKMLVDYKEKKANIEQNVRKLQEDKKGLVAKWLLSLMGWERNDKKIQQKIANLADLSKSSPLQLCKESVEQLESIWEDIKEQDKILDEEKHKAEETAREKEERDQFTNNQQELLDKKQKHNQSLQGLLEQQSQDQELRNTLKQKEKLNNEKNQDKENQDKENQDTDKSQSNQLLSPKELKQLNKDIEKLKKEIQKLSQELTKEFVFTPKKKLLKSSNPSLSIFDSSIQIPHRNLPLVGTLYKSNSNNFLEIENWEDLEVGLTEAQKFDAILVAQRPSKKKPTDT